MNQKEEHHNPEDVLKLKDIVLEHWQQLPAQHQASMALVLLATMMEGEWGDWLRNAIALRWPIEIPQQSTLSFGVSREYLKKVHLSEQDIAQLTDEDLKI